MKAGKAADSGKVLTKRMAKVGIGAAAATQVYKEYEAAENARNKKRNHRGTDRLRQDRKYLNSLSRQLTKRTDISNDTVHDQVLTEAKDVLVFLKQRDMFWDQLQHKWNCSILLPLYFPSMNNKNPRRSILLLMLL